MQKIDDADELKFELVRIANGDAIAYNLSFAAARARRLKGLTAEKRDELLRLLVLGRRNIHTALSDFPRARIERGVDALATVICLAAVPDQTRVSVGIEHAVRWLGHVAEAADIDDRLNEFGHARRAGIIQELKGCAA